MFRFVRPVALILVVGVAGCQAADRDAANREAANREAGGHGADPGNPGFGQQAAMDWCSGCHAIGNGETPEGDAPSFATLLELRPPESIRHYLTWERHPAMPAMALESKDIEDLVAYFAYLESRS